MSLFATSFLILISFLGIVLTRLLPIPLEKKLKTLIGPALGIVVVTELTLLTSLLIGLNLTAIALAVVLFIICIFLLRKIPAGSYVQPNPQNSNFLTHWPLIIILLSIGSIVVFVFWTKVLAPKPYGLQTGGGGLYGDTAMHSAYTMSLVTQGMPPQNPLFAGQPLVYPFLVNLFSATLVLVGSNLRFAFIVPQLLFFLGFTTLFYAVAKKIGGNRVAFLAMLIFFLGWGFGFKEYIADVQKTGSWEVTKEYTNNLPGYDFHNVLTGMIFPERSHLPGLFLGLLITYLIISSLQATNYPPALAYAKHWRAGQLPVLLIGILLGLLPLWHTHTFIFFGVSIAFWILSIYIKNIPSLFQREGQGELIKHLLITFLPALLLSLPVLWWFKSHISGSFLHFQMGWMTSRTDFLGYWLRNSGLVIPLAIIGWVFIKKQWKLFFIPAILMFFVANFVMFQPWEWDNIKLFAWVFLFFAILAAFAVNRIIIWGKKYNFILSTVVLFTVFCVLISFTASGALSVFHITQQEFTIYDIEDQKLAEWVNQNTKPTDVFLIDPQPTHPIPGLTGRSSYLGYPGHLWVHGINYGPREQTAGQILNGQTELLSQTDVPIQYVVTENSKAQYLDGAPNLEKVYSNNKYSVFHVK